MAKSASKDATKAKASSPAEASGDAKGVTKKSKSKNGGPKRASSAWMFFLAENRERIAKQVSENKEVMKVAAEEWKVVKDKSKWEKLAAADKERFEDEKAGA